MKITKIQIYSFGTWRDREWDLADGVTVFEGSNEAGKSTLMAFIRAVLFGFPNRSNMAERYEPVNGGVYGGAMTVVDDSGEAYRIERREGKTVSGIVSVRCSDGTQGGEELLHRLIGGMSAQLFRNIFAFSLTELQEIKTLQDDEIGGYLYSAGMGTGGVSIVDMEKKLDQEMAELFKNSGQKPLINQTLKDIEALEVEIKSLKEQAGRYSEMNDEIANLEVQIAETEQELKRLHNEEAALDRITQARAPWLQWMQVSRELEELPVIERFPVDGVVRLSGYEQQETRLSLELEAKKSKIAAIEQELQQLIVNEQLIERRLDIDLLAEEGAALKEKRDQSLVLKIEIARTEDALQKKLREIDPSWNAQTLTDFAISLAEREQVRQWRTKQEEARKAVDTAEQNLLRYRKLAADAEAAEEAERRELEHLRRQLRETIGKSDDELAVFEQRKIELWERSLAELKRVFSKKEQRHRELAHLSERYKDKQHFIDQMNAWQTEGTVKKTSDQLPVFLLLALTIILPGILLFTANRWLALVAFLILGGFAWYVRGMLTSPSVNQNKASGGTDASHLENELLSIQEQADAAQSDVALLKKQLLELAKPLVEGFTDQTGENANGSLNESLNGIVDEPRLIEWEQHLLRLKAAYEQVQQTARKLAELEKGLKQAHGECEQSRQQWEAAQAVLKGLEQKWSAWLHERRLPLTLTPEGTLEIFQLIEQGKDFLLQINKLNIQLQGIEAQLAQFEHRLEQIAAACGILNDGADRFTAARQLKAESALAKEKLDQRDQGTRRKAELMDQVKEMGLEQASVRQLMNDLLQKGDSEDAETFRMRAEQYKAREALLQTQRQAEFALITLAGHPDRLDALKQSLQEIEPITVEKRLEELRQITEGFRQELDELKDKRGRLRNEIDKLEKDGQLSEKLVIREEHLGSLREQAGRWTALSICSHLFKKARDVYERERQPGVIKTASTFFSQITNYRYARVLAPVGEKKLIVEKEDGGLLETAYLSRGTAEQLYLAMRFALASEYSRQLALPIIMDDIFVNFDAARVDAVLHVMKQVSQQHQILMFTCHPHLTRAMAAVLPHLNLVNLDDQPKESVAVNF